MRTCETREFAWAWLPRPAGYNAYNRGNSTLVDQFGRNECTHLGNEIGFGNFNTFEILYEFNDTNKDKITVLVRWMAEKQRYTLRSCSRGPISTDAIITDKEATQAV